jgi:hypothetical protein
MAVLIYQRTARIHHHSKSKIEELQKSLQISIILLAILLILDLGGLICYITSFSALGIQEPLRRIGFYIFAFHCFIISILFGRITDMSFIQQREGPLLSRSDSHSSMESKRSTKHSHSMSVNYGNSTGLSQRKFH